MDDGDADRLLSRVLSGTFDLASFASSCADELAAELTADLPDVPAPEARLIVETAAAHAVGRLVSAVHVSLIVDGPAPHPTDAALTATVDAVRELRALLTRHPSVDDTEHAMRLAAARSIAASIVDSYDAHLAEPS